MYQLITTKGRHSAETIDELAAWLEEMQPSSSRIVHGDVEAEIDEHLNPNACDAEDYAAAMRWALRIEEAFRLDLTVNNNNIHLVDMDARPLVIVCQGPEGVELHNGNSTRVLDDSEVLADLVKANA